MTNSTLTALKDELAVEQWKSYVDDKTCCVEHAVIEASRAAFDAALKAVRYKEVYEALVESKACWDAAYAEGLPERMNEVRNGESAERLIDLLDSRVFYALAPIVDILAQLPKPEGE